MVARKNAGGPNGRSGDWLRGWAPRFLRVTGSRGNGVDGEWFLVMLLFVPAGWLAIAWALVRIMER